MKFQKKVADGSGTPTQDESPSSAFNRTLDSFANTLAGRNAYGAAQTHYIPPRPTGVSSLVNPHIHQTAAGTAQQAGDVYRPTVYGANYQPIQQPNMGSRLSFPGSGGNLNSTPRSTGSQDSLDAIQATVFDAAEVRSTEYEKYLAGGDSTRHR